MQQRNHRVNPQSVHKSSSQAKGKLFKLTNQWGLMVKGAGSGGLFVCISLWTYHPKTQPQYGNFPNQSFRRLFWLTDEIPHFAIMGCFGILGKWAPACKKDFQILSFMLHSSVLRAELQKLGPSIPAFKQLVCFGGAEPDCTYQWNRIIRVIKCLNGN